MSRTEMFITDHDIVTCFGVAGGGAIEQPETNYKQEFVDVLFIVEEKDSFEDALPSDEGRILDWVKEALKGNESPVSFEDFETEVERWRLVDKYEHQGRNVLNRTRGALLVEATVTSNTPCGHHAATYDSIR